MATKALQCTEILNIPCYTCCMLRNRWSKPSAEKCHVGLLALHSICLYVLSIFLHNPWNALAAAPSWLKSVRHNTSQLCNSGFNYWVLLFLYKVEIGVSVESRSALALRVICTCCEWLRPVRKIIILFHDQSHQRASVLLSVLTGLCTCYCLIKKHTEGMIHTRLSLQTTVILVSNKDHTVTAPSSIRY